MLISAIIGFVIMLATVGYVAFRKFSFTRQEIEFGAPQNGVAAIYLDIREDTVRGLHILYADGTVSEVRRLPAG
ncbi:MAG: hypothetical protein JW990_18375 [Thermoleophilia bacterium]|nr:hypothetical protein [Thermoleophilia bacterium]